MRTNLCCGGQSFVFDAAFTFAQLGGAFVSAETVTRTVAVLLPPFPSEIE